MSDETNAFLLTSRRHGEPAPVLIGVQAQGRLDAILFELTLRQTYKNTSDRVLEVVYTFPLPHHAVLLGFASELNGERQDGVIVAAAQAERAYEASLEAGDAPVMLEANPGGLHTANIGNLKPGDEIVLECRFAQLIGAEQGRLRVAIPTTIAPRYGDPGRAGLQPQQAPLATLEADYPLVLAISIGEALAGASVACPTHRVITTPGEHGTLRIELASGSRLDRDVVFLVTPREHLPSLRITASDAVDPATPFVMMAALQPPPGTPRARVSVKLLVDCSGSMGGDSIASARAALRGVVAGLSETDSVSLSRFGSSVEHVCAPALAKPQALRHLAACVDGLQADLGGTEMEAALGAVFALAPSTEPGGADVLLITDGEVWDADAMVDAALASHHRIFAIGVGASPAEGVLRALAESTGGACEFATPGEALEAAAHRMLRRMREPAYAHPRIDWGVAPAWSTRLAAGVFGGDTLVAFAGFSRPAGAGAVRLLADDEHGRTIELARSEADAPCAGDSLPRIAAARRMADATDAEARDLAVAYQLMSAHTHCILVHRRAEADKAAEAAQLHRVESMLAAGWGGIGTVGRGILADQTFGDAFSIPIRAMARISMEAPAVGDVKFCMIDASSAAPATLATVARRVERHVSSTGKLDGLAFMADLLDLHDDLRRAIDDAVLLGLGRDEAWLLLARWVNERADGLAEAALAALLKPLVAAIDPARAAAAVQVFEHQLGRFGIEAWETPRAQRLRRAMGGRA